MKPEYLLAIVVGALIVGVIIVRVFFYFLNRRAMKENALCPWNPDSRICECMAVRKETAEDHVSRDSSIQPQDDLGAPRERQRN